MEDNKKNFFWASYLDLMTALFAVVLVLFILSFKQFEDERKRFLVKQEEFNKVEEIKKNLEILMSDTAFFKYEKDYKRYRLAQSIKFYKNKYEIDKYSVENYEEVSQQLKKTGEKLRDIIQSLKKKKDIDSAMKELSYLLIISGRSSDLPGDDRIFNYELSYKRALSLYNFWINTIDFDDENFHRLLDFQIAGNGIGGIGRFKRVDSTGSFSPDLEMKNQSFLIQILPKVGEIDTTLSNSIN